MKPIVLIIMALLLSSVVIAGAPKVSPTIILNRIENPYNISANDTDDLKEGSTNLYYTRARWLDDYNQNRSWNESSGSVFLNNPNHKVGIGTSSPSQLLSVGNESFSTGVPQATPSPDIIQDNKYDSSGNPSINKWVMYNTASFSAGIGMSTNDMDFLIGTASNAGGFRFYGSTTNIDGTGANHLMSILGNGNVGIGTVTPAVPLEVQGALVTGAIMRLWSTDGQAADRGGGINYGGKYTNAGAQTSFAIIQGVKENSVDGEYGGELKFSTRVHGEGALTEAMRIDAAQQVGIGTTSPTSKLHVAGDTNITGNLTVETNVTIEQDLLVKNWLGIGIDKPARNLHIHEPSPSFSWEQFTNTDTGATDTDGLKIGISASEIAYLWNYENTPMVFGNNNDEKMRIEADGDVVIGDSTAAADLELDTDTTPDFRIEHDTSAGFGTIDFYEDTTRLTAIQQIGSNVAAGRNNDLEITNLVGDIVLSRTQVGNVGIGISDPAATLDIDSNSNTENLRLRGADATNEIADIFIGSTGELFIDLTEGADTKQYLDIKTEDDKFGIVQWESAGASAAAYLNTYVVNAATDYASFNLNAVTTTDSLNIDASNNVGIGAISSGAKLHVAGDTNITGNLTVETNATIEQDLLVSGNVGIGTTVPDELLHLKRTTATNTGVIMENSVGTWQLYTGTDGRFRLVDLGTSKFPIQIDENTPTATFVMKDTGNVGIGTATPATTLDIDSNSNTENLRLRGADAPNEIADIYIDTGGQIVLDTTASGDTAPYISLKPKDNQFGLILWESDGGTAAYSNFYVKDGSPDYMSIDISDGSGTDTDALNIDANDNIGIGGISSNAKLHVAGDTNITGNLTVGDNALTVNVNNGRIGIGTSSPGSKVDIYNTNTEAGTSWYNTANSNRNYASISMLTNAGRFWLRDASNNIKIDLNANPSINSYINSGANFGINTNSPTSKLHVVGDTNITGNITGNQIYGEMWAHNDSNYWTDIISTQGEWINITLNSSISDETGQTLNGFTFDAGRNALLSGVSGLYKVDYSISTGNEGNNQEYQFVIATNNIPNDNTDVHRKIGAAGDVGNAGSSSFIRLQSGDFVQLQARNNDGTSNLRPHSVNVNLWRIGD